MKGVVQCLKHMKEQIKSQKECINKKYDYQYIEIYSWIILSQGYN